MTGFASAEASADGHAVRVVLRSVNHRHLDLRLHLPESLRDGDDIWSERIRKHLRRGRVEVAMEIERQRDPERLTFDREMVSQVAREVQGLQSAGLVSGGISGGDLLAWGQALVSQTEPADPESLLEVARQCFDEALAALIATRRSEGSRLAELLIEGVERVRALSEQMIGRRADVESQLAAEYRRRLLDLGAGEQLGEERVALEVAAAIDKASITEETDRLVAHCDHFQTEVQSKRPSGRKLDFIVQEMFREVNTIAAKARDTALVHLAIEGKSVCEDLREQLRNVE